MAAGLASASAVAVVNFEYTHSFAHAGDPVVLTTEAQAGVADYFHVSPGFPASQTRPNLVTYDTWSLSRAGASVANRTLNTKSWDTNVFAERSLYAGDALASGLTLDTFSATVDSWYYWGANGDGTLRSYIGLLNTEGDGYVATFYRKGQLVISKVTGGLSGTWTTLVSEDNYDLAGTNTTGYQKATFELTASGLTLSTVDSIGTTLGSVSVVLSAQEILSGFTTVALGSRQGGGEENYFGTLALTGTAAAVPEPSTAALLLGLGALGVATGTRLVRNRR